MIMISSGLKTFGNIFKYFGILINDPLRSWGIDGLDVWTSSENSCEIMPWCSFFNNFFMPLELITLLGFPVIPLNSISFPSNETFMKSSWKVKATFPNDYNHWIPSTTSTPPMGITIIGLFITYSPIVRLILFHFPKQLIVPPSVIITWNSGAGYTKQLRSLANL